MKMMKIWNLMHLKVKLLRFIFLEIQLKFPFDITKERFLNSLVGLNANFKIRLYLISCQNLSAVDSNIDLKSRLAGL
jgi:hypothetical protein